MEEDNQKGDRSVTIELVESKANLVEGESSKAKTKSHVQGNKRKSTYSGPTDRNPKKIKRSCRVCRIPGHHASDYRHKKGSNEWEGTTRSQIKKT